MEVWIYDEDKWPSGCAGGLVSHANPREYSAKGLTMELMSSEEIEKAVKKGRAFDTEKEYEDGKILRIYTIWTSGYKILKLKRNL